MKYDPAWTIFSKYIRKRDNYTCQRCGAVHDPSSRGLHASHYFGRGGYSTRYDPDNCVALCYGCHKYWDEQNRPEYTDFKTKQLGQERYDELVYRANHIKKRTSNTKKEMLQYAKDMLASLDSRNK